MNSSLSRPKVVGRALPTITGNRHHNLFDPRTMDSLIHAVNMLLDARYIIVDQNNPRKNVPIVTDSRITIPLAIPSAAGLGFSTLYVVEHRDEYVSCVTLKQLQNGTLTKTIKVAKPPGMRTSRITENLPDGTTETYSSWDITQQSRQASGSDGNSEQQFITPRYLICDPVDQTNWGEFILATNMDSLAQDEDGKKIGMIDMNIAGRAYAAPQ